MITFIISLFLLIGACIEAMNIQEDTAPLERHIQAIIRRKRKQLENAQVLLEHIQRRITQHNQIRQQLSDFDKNQSELSKELDELNKQKKAELDKLLQEYQRKKAHIDNLYGSYTEDVNKRIRALNGQQQREQEKVYKEIQEDNKFLYALPQNFLQQTQPEKK